MGRLVTVLPREVYVIYVGLDGKVKAEGVVVNDAIPHVIQLPLDSCNTSDNEVNIRSESVVNEGLKDRLF